MFGFPFLFKVNTILPFIKKLSPIRLLVYGGMIEYDYKDIEVIYYDNEVTKRMKG